MSKIGFSIKKTAVVIAAFFSFCFILFECGCAMANAGKAYVADFAYPADEARRADSLMNLSLRRGDERQALEAAVRLCVARSLINRSNVAQEVALLDSVGSLVSEPWRSVASLLEAQVYVDMYSDRKYIFDRRTLPSGEWPADPEDWSGALVAEKVEKLVEASMAGYGSASDMALSTLDRLVASTKNDSLSPHMSAADFLAVRGIDCLSPFLYGGVGGIIPFDSSSQVAPGSYRSLSLLRDRIIDIMISSSESSDNVDTLVAWVLQYADTLDIEDREECLLDWMHRLDSYSACARIVEKYGNEKFGNDINSIVPTEGASYREFFEYVTTLSKRYTGTAEHPILENLIERMSRPGVIVNLDSQYLPGNELKGSVDVANTENIWLLMFPSPQSSDSDGMPLRKLLSVAKPVAKVKIEGVSEVPMCVHRDFSFSPVPPGRYVVVPSFTSDRDGVPEFVKENGWSQSTVVSDLTLITATSSGTDPYGRIYVANARNNHPVENAEVRLMTYVAGNLVTKHTLRSGSDGSVRVLEGSWVIRASKDGSVADSRVFLRKYDDSRSPRPMAQVFTDLSIYHPGDTVGFAVVAYSMDKRSLTLDSGKPLTVKLFDANHKAVDSISLTTGADGRCVGSFALPSAGLLGTWMLSVEDADIYLGDATMEVADYRQSTFYVELNPLKEIQADAESVNVDGFVATYSGMPLGNSELNYTVTWTPWWRYGARGGNATYGGKCVANADGLFEFSLPVGVLKGTKYEHGVFNVSVYATSPSGETAEARALRFSLGKGYSVASDIKPVTLISDGNVSWSVNVTDMLGTSVKREVEYKITDLETMESVASGIFESPLLRLPSSKIAPGKYLIDLMVCGDSASATQARTVVWNDKSDLMPLASSLWAPATVAVASPGKNNVEVRFGNSWKDDLIFCLVTGTDGYRETKWIKSNGKLQTIAFDAPPSGERRYISLSGMHDLDGNSMRIELKPADADLSLKVETLSWRDRMEPGAKEKWSFRFQSPSVGDGNVSVLAVMTDKAINSIVPFKWSFSPRRMLNFSNPVSFSAAKGAVKMMNDFSLSALRSKAMPMWIWPSWNFYGHNLYDSGIRMLNQMKTMASRATSGGMESEMMFYAVEEVADYASPSMKMTSVESAADVVEESALDDAEVYGTNGEDDDNTPLRELEHPLAFFNGTLICDSAGNVEVAFDVPDFNTTWQFQILGYDSHLYTTSIIHEAVSSKPVMVSTNAPRFLRTGDDAVVEAVIFNNTDSTAMIGGKLIACDPLSGKMLCEAAYEPQSVEPAANRIISLKINVPYDLTAILLKSYATSGSHTDGEQSVVPVYPSVSPVIEGKSFYIAPGAETAEWKLPKMTGDSKVTLQYCDNPVWLCVQALPDISTPSSSSVTEKMRALYGNLMAVNIADSYPRVREAILLWTSGRCDSLRSPLELDGQLKRVMLNNTPWLDNAETETIRMNRLSTLLDTVVNKTVTEGLLADIGALQNMDGGWSWCPSMPSSEYMTQRAIGFVGIMRRCGVALPAGLVDMTSRAIAYCDSVAVAEWRRNKKNYHPSSLLDYIYSRQNAAVKSRAVNGWKDLEKKAIADIASEWKQYSIFDKASAAVVLWRSGDRKTPKLIFESLRQYASYSPEKGAWYANLKSEGERMTGVMTTCRVLESFDEVNPTDEMVNKLRQWLLISRQTLDWGKELCTVEAVAAILGSGKDWIQTSSNPELVLNGKNLPIDSLAAFTGSFSIELDSSEASGATLSIRRDAKSPAWGGTVTSRIMPMKDVKAYSSNGLGVRKAMYAIEAGANGEEAVCSSSKGATKLRKGDMVRVTLTLESNEDMNYVALTDELPACIRPSVQTASYEVNDGLWIYREPRASEVNLFISFLPKGKHVLTYDCYVMCDGTYSLGIATAQSQYAPVMTGHSSGGVVEVKSAL